MYDSREYRYTNWGISHCLEESYNLQYLDLGLVNDLNRRGKLLRFYSTNFHELLHIGWRNLCKNQLA